VIKQEYIAYAQIMDCNESLLMTLNNWWNLFNFYMRNKASYKKKKSFQQENMHVTYKDV